MTDYPIRNALESDLDRCYQIEQMAYEGDEAATREKIRHRIRTYPQGFIVLESGGQVAGFINCGATDDVDLADEAFKDLDGHNPDGRHVVIFSVVVHPDYQGQGLAGKLMLAFIRRMKQMNKQSIHLICRDHHIDFYAKYGFDYIRESTSTHGGLSWHDMELKLTNS